MRRSLVLAALLAVIVLIPAATPANAQQRDFSKVEIKPTRVARNVHMLKARRRRLGRPTASSSTTSSRRWPTRSAPPSRGSTPAS
jgi:hypothetical protein